MVKKAALALALRKAWPPRLERRIAERETRVISAGDFMGGWKREKEREGEGSREGEGGQGRGEGIGAGAGVLGDNAGGRVAVYCALAPYSWAVDLSLNV